MLCGTLCMGYQLVIYINKNEEHLFLVDLVILCHIIIYYITKVGLRMKNLSKTSSFMLPFFVIIYGWLEIKLEWRVPKVIQLIFLGKFLESSWSIKKLGKSKTRDHPKVWFGLPLQRAGSS